MKKICIFLLLILGSLSVQIILAEDDTPIEGVLDTYYQDGQKAYENKDYINAIKFLFAYKVTHHKLLLDKSTFEAALNKTIEYSEMQLREALRSKENNYLQKWQANNSMSTMEHTGTTNASWNSEDTQATKIQEMELVNKQIDLRKLEVEILRLKMELQNISATKMR